MRVIHTPGCHFQTTTPFLYQKKRLRTPQRILLQFLIKEENVKLYFLVESLNSRSFNALDEMTTRYVTHGNVTIISRQKKMCKDFSI